MFTDTESLFAAISTELALNEARQPRFQGFDPETGATIFFPTMEALTEWMKS